MHPTEKIEIIGCNNDVQPGEKAGGTKLSEARANVVYNYLKDV
jgi:outer membrane protein OmpA-like peptidoglycan-associated protein